jgi:hypothetical protein
LASIVDASAAGAGVSGVAVKAKTLFDQENSFQAIAQIFNPFEAKAIALSNTAVQRRLAVDALGH